MNRLQGARSGSPAGACEAAGGPPGLQRGSAMVVVLLVTGVLTGLATMIFNIGAANLANSGRDRLAGNALGAAEAGVAHAIAHMRSNGVGQMTCDGPFPASASCTNPWGFNHPTAGAGGQTVSLGAGRSYKAWVQRIQTYTPGSATPAARYRIHASGTGGSAGGARRIAVDVAVKPFTFPIGIFGRDYVRDAGRTTIRRASLFSLGCIGKRNNLSFDTSGNDLAHPELVPAAHSAKYISTSNVTSESDPDCAPGENRNIHRPPPAGPGFCNPGFRFDRDNQGGLPLVGTACDPVLNGGRGLISSFFDEAALRTYGYSEPRGLPANQYAFLAGTARQQGNFYDCTASPPSAGCNSTGDLTNMAPINGAVRPNVVVYAKLSPNKKFTLSPSLLSGYEEAFCGSRSILLVVEGGDLTLNSNLDFVGSVFVPDGIVNLTGGARLVGTVFAKRIFMAGNSEITLKGQCFFDNLPAGVLSLTPQAFQEVDR